MHDNMTVQAVRRPRALPNAPSRRDREFFAISARRIRQVSRSAAADLTPPLNAIPRETILSIKAKRLPGAIFGPPAASGIIRPDRWSAEIRFCLLEIRS